MVLCATLIVAYLRIMIYIINLSETQMYGFILTCLIYKKIEFSHCNELCIVLQIAVFLIQGPFFSDNNLSSLSSLLHQACRRSAEWITTTR
jgi:hypothetical protein